MYKENVHEFTKNYLTPEEVETIRKADPALLLQRSEEEVKGQPYLVIKLATEDFGPRLQADLEHIITSAGFGIEQLPK
jgi:hypothetical protein